MKGRDGCISYYLNTVQVKTDANGRWQTDEAPPTWTRGSGCWSGTRSTSPTTNLSYDISALEPLPAASTVEQLYDQTAQTVLKEGTRFRAS